MTDRRRLERRAERGDLTAKSRLVSERVIELERRWEAEHGQAIRALFAEAGRDKEALRDLLREMNAGGGGPWDFHVQRVAAEFLEGLDPEGRVRVLAWTKEFVGDDRDPRGEYLGRGRAVNPHVAFAKLRLFSRLMGPGQAEPLASDPRRDAFLEAIEEARSGPFVVRDRKPRRISDAGRWIVSHAGAPGFWLTVVDAGGRPEAAAERFYAGDPKWRDADPEALVVAEAESETGKSLVMYSLWPSWFGLWEFLRRPSIMGGVMDWFGTRRPAGWGNAERWQGSGP